MLPDRNKDGQADRKEVFASGLNQPHGLALHGGYLYVATTDPRGAFSLQGGRPESQRPAREPRQPAQRGRAFHAHRRLRAGRPDVRRGRKQLQRLRGERSEARRHLGLRRRRQERPGIRQRPAQRGGPGMVEGPAVCHQQRARSSWATTFPPKGSTGGQRQVLRLAVLLHHPARRGPGVGQGLWPARAPPSARTPPRPSP